ncbi:phosphoketolase [Rhizobium grahamii CCGE 502]|uniref:Phosphoketolase n=1 Tax=Rhizobium grahamii CCGE 502 TaxID=990285 RepID=S3HER2_9HYPH|nr:phosphoketolase [Rhizobium grahamii CCGE 502]
MRSYKPEELFDPRGRLKEELRELAPKGEKRMGAIKFANGGGLRTELILRKLRNTQSRLAIVGRT